MSTVPPSHDECYEFKYDCNKIKDEAEDELIEEMLISGCFLHNGNRVHGIHGCHDKHDNDDKMKRITFSIGLLADSGVGAILPDQIKVMLKKKINDYRRAIQIAEHKQSIKDLYDTTFFDMKLRTYMTNNIPGYGPSILSSDIHHQWNIPLWKKGGWDYQLCKKNIEKLDSIL
jgi:hypothetical protein